MPRQIVIQFMPDGTVAHTRDKDLDLSETLGARRKIDRISDIVFDEETQGFYIKFLRGIIPDWVHPIKDSSRTFIGPLMLYNKKCWARFEYQLGATIDQGDAWIEGGVLYFKTYEEAVAYEIAIVNAIRLVGGTF